MTDASSRLVWRQLHWARPVEPERAVSVLRQWAADGRSPLVVLEAVAEAGEISYRLGTLRPALSSVQSALAHTLPGTTFTEPTTERQPVQLALKLKASTRHRALRSDSPETTIRSILGALAQTGKGERLVLQLVLGPRRVPLAVPTHSPSSIVAPWYQIAWYGKGGTVDSEKRTALRDKVSDHGFACSLRIGVSAASAGRRRALVLGLLAAIRTSEAAGALLKLKPEQAKRLNTAGRPLWWPLRINVNELLALTAWPLGSDDLPGLPAAHPRPLPPTPGTAGAQRVIARATAPGVDATLALPAKAALQHLHVIGPTGVGKSVLLGRLIQQDIAAGHGVVVIEPKGDLVADVLGHIPAERRDDVVVLDAADPAPVGLNPLSAGGRPEVTADLLLAVFKALYAESWGPRTQDILHACLLTLARRDDATLVMLPLLLTDAGFRRSMTSGLNDPLALSPFWAWYDQLAPGERAQAIAPLMNKLRQWLLRPSLRAVLGQREPRFQLSQVFTENKILLVPLRKAILGPEAAALLGSLVVAQLWQAIQARAAIPASQRQPVMVYIDEVQDYLHLPTDLGDALAQARGFGVGFTLAHQFLGQLPPPMRAAVLSNARSRVCFQLSREDASLLAKGHPELGAEDFTSLGQYQVYASLFARGAVSPYASGRTLPPTKAISRPSELLRASRQRYGRPLDEIEAGFADLLATTGQGSETALGRRRRTAP